jgi:hypothetical protein
MKPSRDKFETWINEPCNNFKDQASIYWSAYARGHKDCYESMTQQCTVCGDHHEGDIPRECETGDGV